MHACSTLLLTACSACALGASVLDDVRLHPANEPRQQLRQQSKYTLRHQQSVSWLKYDINSVQTCITSPRHPSGRRLLAETTPAKPLAIDLTTPASQCNKALTGAGIVVRRMSKVHRQPCAQLGSLLLTVDLDTVCTPVATTSATSDRHTKKKSAINTCATHGSAGEARGL